MPVAGQGKGIIMESYGEHFESNHEQKKLTVQVNRHPYKPFGVYKILLKVALSLIDDEDSVSNYQDAIKLLLAESDVEMPEILFYRANLYVDPGPPFPSPLVLLFTKIDIKEHLTDGFASSF